MYRHARNTMLHPQYDYQLTAEDIKAWQHNWTASKRTVDKLSTLEAGAKLKGVKLTRH